MDTRYRIFTEDLNRDALLQVLGRRFQAYAVLTAAGAWLGKQERTICIEIDGTEAERPAVQETAREIKKMNCQDAVLVTEEPIRGFPRRSPRMTHLCSAKVTHTKNTIWRSARA